MPERYEPAAFEAKWRTRWAEHELFRTREEAGRKKFYSLDFFPYPSGAGLSVGHCRNYVPGDVLARFKFMQGYNVLHPMGFDAFGLPAENAAIKEKARPGEMIDRFAARYKEQMDLVGISYDWSRSFKSSDPTYYKWTQWIFEKLYERGLAYRAAAEVNWCPKDKTALANEEVVGGLCERCGTPVEKRAIPQWFFRITEYAQRLIDDLDTIDWPEGVKALQRNWIGRSDGAEFEMRVTFASGSGTVEDELQALKEEVAGEDIPISSMATAQIAEIEAKMFDRARSIDPSIMRGEADLELKEKSLTFRVFTTRLDTIFGMTFCVLAPEHPLVEKIMRRVSPEQAQAIREYQEQAKRKSEAERTMETKDKSGVFTGAYAINPANGKRVPIWIADYVLANYGTAAIMAVPAHDQRDFDFAAKHRLEIVPVIRPRMATSAAPIMVQNAIRLSPKTDPIEMAINIWSQDHVYSEYPAQFRNELENFLTSYHPGAATSSWFNAFEGTTEAWLLNNPQQREYILGFAETADIGAQAQAVVLSQQLLPNGTFDERHAAAKVFIESLRNWGHRLRQWFPWFGGLPFLTEDGILANSGQFDGEPVDDAKRKLGEWMEQQGIGERKVQYKLRDWLISRQRYWGCPIPIIHTKDGEMQLVPADCLPVYLPDVESYEPSDDGTSPLARIDEFVNVTDLDGRLGRRETDTMGGFACSSWYFLRFCDPFNEEEAWDKAKVDYWMPVDCYIGGVEHAVMHLLYARFWTKVFFDLGLVNFKEPFARLKNQGQVLAMTPYRYPREGETLQPGEEGILISFEEAENIPDDQKFYRWARMSKSKGNVVTPEEAVEEYGADALRMFELFVAPFEADVNWSNEGMNGMVRFLSRVCRFVQDRTEAYDPDWKAKIGTVEATNESLAIRRATHKAIAKATEDIDRFAFNTFVSALMIFVNSLYDSAKGQIGEAENLAFSEAIDSLILMISPGAPHTADELWESIGRNGFTYREEWPSFDPALTVDDLVTIAVQVNGKLRDTIEAPAGASEEALKEFAQASEKVKGYMEGQQIVKIIVVPSKLVNIVVRPS